MWKIEKTRKNFLHEATEADSRRAKWAESGRGTATRAQGTATKHAFRVAVPAGGLVKFACEGVCDGAGPLGPLGPLHAHIPPEIPWRCDRHSSRRWMGSVCRNASGAGFTRGGRPW